MLQKATRDFEYISAPLDDTDQNALSLATVVRAKVMQSYGSEPEPLNLVAITDAGKTIGSRRTEKGVDLAVSRRQKKKR